MVEDRNKLHEGALPEEATVKFEFQNATRLIFTAGALSRLGEVVRAQGKRTLLVTGGRSVKRSGTFERAVSIQKAAGGDPRRSPSRYEVVRSQRGERREDDAKP